MVRDSLHTAIDLGTSKVTTLMARLGRDGIPELIGVGISPSQGVRKGVVVNIQEAQDSVRESVDEAIRSSGVSSPGAHVGITGDHLRMSVRRASVRSPYYNAPITSDAIDRSIQAIKPLDLPPEQQLLHVVPLSYAVDGLKGVRNPIGMHALRLDLEALCVVGGSGPVQNLSRAVAGSKVAVRSLVASSLAVGESVLTKDEKEMGVVLVEIGGGATTVSVFQQGRLCNAVVLPVGGYQFTTDLSVALNSPFDIAEEVKLRFGHVIPEEIGGEQVEVEAFGDRRTVKVERREVCRYLHDRAEEILRLASHSRSASSASRPCCPRALSSRAAARTFPAWKSWRVASLTSPSAWASPEDWKGCRTASRTHLMPPASAPSCGGSRIAKWPRSR